MSSPPIVVVGSFVQDLFFDTPSFPRPGQTVIGTFRTGPGGKGSNQAVAAARAGGSTAFVGAVGHDAFADGAKEFLTAEGVQHHLTAKPGHATGTAAILVDATGQNQIVVALGANDAIQPGELPAALIGGARFVVSQLEISLPAALEALRIGKKGGATTILNTAPMRADFDPAMLDLTDILVPNETEFAALVNMLPRFGRTDFSDEGLAALAPDALHAMCRRMGPAIVLVTLGARGGFLSLPDRCVTIPAVAGVKVVDTTGAGDAFVGAFAAALVEFDGDAERAARFANVAAAISVTRPGTAPAVATRSEIDALLATLI